MQEPKTYRSDNVKLVLGGTHIASGMAKDSFIKITPNGGDTSYVAGAYGEIVRTIDPTKMFNVTIQTLYGSSTDSWLMQRYKRDRKNGDGMFPMMVWATTLCSTASIAASSTTPSVSTALPPPPTYGISSWATASSRTNKEVSTWR